MTGHLSRQPKAAHGPGRAGKFRTLACAALAGGMFLFAVSPAEAQVWSATLTVDQVGAFFGCSIGVPSHTPCSTALSDGDFAYGGTNYSVDHLFWRDDNRLFLGLDNVSPTAIKTALSGLVLNVDGHRFAISAAGLTSDSVHWAFDPNPDWTDGQTLSVSLSLPVPSSRPNRPPKVSASCNPCEVSPGGEVRLKATASDPDGGVLKYRWSAKEGTFIGVTSGATARWQAPSVAGRYRVTVVVSDRSGASDSSTVEINVNSPPTVSLSCEGMCRARQGLSVRLEAEASDPDGHELSYAWSAGSGSFIGETDTATAQWRAPAEAGAVAIRVTVSDEQGGSTSAEVDVAVDPLSNQSAVFASYLVSMPSENPDQVIDTYLSVSNVLSAPEGVETAGGPYEGDDKVGTLEIHLYGQDGDEPMIYKTTGDSPGSGLDENGNLAPGQTYTVRLAELIGEDRAFVGYGWIVGNFDGIAGTRTIINFGQGVASHGDLTPKLSRHGAGVKPIPPLE